MQKVNKKDLQNLIQESYFDKIDKKVLSILLKDKTTNKNIIWAKNDVNFAYIRQRNSIKLNFDKQNNLKGIYKQFNKSAIEKDVHMKENAAVYTPAFVCNMQNNMFDSLWFKRKNVFNAPLHNGWMVTKNKISFSQNQSWQDYVQLKVLEITCGEAPYIASRYDVLNGKFIDIKNRIGILDRKIRVINENTNSDTEWFAWVIKAYQSVYGFELFGDSLLIARKNLLFTFIDYYLNRFKHFPRNDYLEMIAKIIAWNFWQMDGMKLTIPHSAIKEPSFGDFLPRDHKSEWENQKNANADNEIKCLIKNWSNNKKIIFEKIRITSEMKFDFVIGNPPYQKNTGKTENQTQGNSSWIYPHFQFLADKIGKCSCLIYPFEGWFDARTRLSGLGKTVLEDGHTIVLYAYEGTYDKRSWFRKDKMPDPFFKDNVDLSAGVCIVLRDQLHHDYFEYMNRVYSDVIVNINLQDSIHLPPNPLFLEINKKLSESKKLYTQVKKGIFGIESDFVQKNPNKVSFNINDWNDPIQLVTNDKTGTSGRSKKFYTDKQNIPSGQKYFDYYKVIMRSAFPKRSLVLNNPTVNNVHKRIGEIVEVLLPNSAFGKSKIALFMTKSKEECDNFWKYLKTDFFAGLVLQEPNRRSTFGEIIPDQDFSNNSDIDWSKSIAEIDIQLFQKYKLTKAEIEYIKKFEK